MLTICLIIPPSIFLLDERVFMTLGHSQSRGRARAIWHHRGNARLVRRRELRRGDPQSRRRVSAKIFGLTATTPQMLAVGRIQQVLRATRPDARLILGGPHVTLVHAAAKKEHARRDPGRAARALAQLSGLFDVLVAGDGEVAIFRALEDDAPPAHRRR